MCGEQRRWKCGGVSCVALAAASPLQPCLAGKLAAPAACAQGEEGGRYSRSYLWALLCYWYKSTQDNFKVGRAGGRWAGGA